MKTNHLKMMASYTLMLSFLLFASCDPTKNDANGKNEGDPPKAQTVRLKKGTIEPKKVRGGNYPATKRDPERPLNEVERPFIVPDGPIRGKLKPLNKKSAVKKSESAGPSQSVDFGDYDELPDATASAHRLVPEPSVAENGQTIMTTGNDWMSLSEDGGGTFTTVDPSTIFPEDYGGYCCDQVLQYVPKYDIFVWLLQYRASGGTNAIRIAVQNTNEVRSSNGTSWTYYDFLNTTFSATGQLDYNDMSFGRTNLYWTSSVGGGNNRYVIRIPLSELAAKGTINFGYTGATAAYWSHVTQSGGDGVYWAGHKDNSTMTVYSMMDGDGFYSWRDVEINSWPNGTISSIAQDGDDWLLDANWKTYVRAAAMDREKIYFAWNASAGNGFPQAHVQIVEINSKNFTLTRQMQIWNPDFAFGYPYFDTNAEGQLGIITGFGGGDYNASGAVGVWGDFVVYCPRFSSVSKENFGHYHTIRRSASNTMQWAAAGYSYEADGSILPWYVRFSHN